MDKNEIKLSVQKVFQETFQDDTIEIRDDMVADDVDNWDSLNHSIMISNVEELFKIKFGIREILKMENVGDMLVLIDEKINN